jgi:hypothetical protein
MRKDTEDLRSVIPVEEFDYQAIIQALKGYAYPRDKITELLKQGIIIRIKKGIYIFGKKYARQPFSRELLANLIYGPSYVSLDYALHYHGLIPERVEALTSITSGRTRRFTTPVGLFTYHGVPINAYYTGITRIELEGGRSFLIATPEKALADKIYTDRGTGIRTQAAMSVYLLESLRIDPEDMSGLDTERLNDITKHYKSRNLDILCDFVCRIRAERRKQ